MKIAIINQPLGNRGDEAAHRALITALSKALPDAQLDVIWINASPKSTAQLCDLGSVLPCVNYVSIRGFSRGARRLVRLCMMLGHDNLALVYPLLRHFASMIGGYDRVVCAPGGICMGGFMDWNHIWQLKVALERDIPTLYWARSIGPFSDIDKAHARFKEESFDLIKSFEYISLRDEVSLGIARDLRADCGSVIDSAFLTVPQIAIPRDIAETLGDVRYVVYVPNELRWHYKYEACSRDAIDGVNLEVMRLIRDAYPQHRILMLPQTYASDINDFGYFMRLREKSGLDGVEVIDEGRSSDVQQAIIRGADLVVGARYHSVVFAINNDVPFLSLSYEHKMRGLLSRLSLESNQVDLEDALVGHCNLLGFFMEVREKLEGELACGDAPMVAHRIAREGFEDMLMHLA